MWSSSMSIQNEKAKEWFDLLESDPQLSHETKVKLQGMLFQDPVLFRKTILAQQFHEEIPWLHRGIYAILHRKTDFLWQYGEIEKIEKNFVVDLGEDENAPLGEDGKRPHKEFKIFDVDYENKTIKLRITVDVGFIIPRGLSKTTSVDSSVLFDILFQQEKFILFVSKAEKHAVARVVYLRQQFESNSMLKLLFGDFQPKKSEEFSWTDSYFETTSGIHVLAKGSGSQIRGINMKGFRPTLLVGDDLEDNEGVETQEKRQETRDWYAGSFEPCKQSPSSRIILLGTKLHKEDLISSLRDTGMMTVVQFSSIDKDGEAVWPWKRSLEVLERLKRVAVKMGTLVAFYLEYMSELLDESTKPFLETMFRYFPHSLDDCPVKAIAFDPAISKAEGADFCAFAVVGMSNTGKIVVYESFCEQGMDPTAQVDKYFELAHIYKPELWGVESVAYQASLVHILTEAMHRKGIYAPNGITPITHSNKTKKDMRIKGILVPRFKNGYVVFTKKFRELEKQLLEFPGGKKDGVDALAMAVALLDPAAAYAAQLVDEEGKEQPKDFSKNQYPSLKVVMGGKDWRKH